MKPALVGVASAGPAARYARWLAVPVFVGLFALIAMGVSTEDSKTYQDNQLQLAETPLENSTGQPIDQPSPSADDNGATNGSAGGPGAAGTALASETSGRGDVLIQGDAGSLTLELGDGQSTATPAVEAGAETVGAVVLQPDPDGAATELRLETDGQLLPLAGDEIDAGDLVVRPIESGVEIVGADGTNVSIERNGAQDQDTRPGLAISETSPDGATSELLADETGLIDLGDGVSILVTPEPSPEPTNPPDDDSSRPWPLIMAALALLIALSALAVLLARRRRPEEPFGVDFVGPEGIPPDRFEDFMAMLRADPIPGRAVRLAFLAAERGLPGLPARYPMETAFEWVGRVAAHRPDVRQPLYSLARHFTAARFTNDETSEAERTEALDALREIERLGRTPSDGQKVPMVTA